jgi:hypothetical protein
MMSAALRINNKTITGSRPRFPCLQSHLLKIRTPLLLRALPKSQEIVLVHHRRHPLTPKCSTASSSLDKATAVADPDQVICVEPSAQAAGATSDLLSANPSVMHASSLYADRIPVIDATSVASNNHLVAPVVNNNPLTTPSHSRYLLPTEKIERLSKKPTKAQVVQITTNLRRESCHYLPIDVVLPENYDSFETLLMLQYAMNPSKMEECTHWKHWDREKFCQELLSAVPDNSVVRPDSATTFVECIAQMFLQFNLADPAMEEAFDQQLQAIDRRFPDATPEQHLRAVQILISRLPELPIYWRAILQRLINGQEVHITTVKGSRFTWLTQLAMPRQIKEMAEEYGYIVSYSEHTRQLADKPIKKKQSGDESSRITTTSTAKVLCSGCGRDNHLVATCRFKSTVRTRGRKHTNCFLPNTLTLQSSHSRSYQRTTLTHQRRGHPLRSTDRNPTVSHRLYPTYSVRCIAIPPITIILTFLYRPHCRQASEQEITSRRCSTRAP